MSPSMSMALHMNHSGSWSFSLFNKGIEYSGPCWLLSLFLKNHTIFACVFSLCMPSYFKWCVVTFCGSLLMTSLCVSFWLSYDSFAVNCVRQLQVCYKHHVNIRILHLFKSLSLTLSPLRPRSPPLPGIPYKTSEAVDVRNKYAYFTEY